MNSFNIFYLRCLKRFLKTCPHKRKVVDSAAVWLVGMAAAVTSFVESTIFHDHGINVFSEITNHFQFA